MNQQENERARLMQHELAHAESYECKNCRMPTGYWPSNQVCAALASRAPATSDTKGQRCCEQGNFGEPHDCAKGQPSESTREGFEKWWAIYSKSVAYHDEHYIDHELIANAGWQARGTSEYERGRRDGLEKSAKDSGTAQAWGEHIGFKIGLATAAQHKYSHGRNGCQCSCGAYFNFNRAEIDWPAHIIALAATSGTPAEHNPARAPHNKFASLWCDACPRPTSGTPAPPDPERIVCEACEGVGCGACNEGYIYFEAAAPPADETLPAEETLMDVVARLRAIPNNALNDLDDPLEEMRKIRHGDVEREMLEAAPTEAPLRKRLEGVLPAIAIRIHAYMSAAQNLPYEEGETCEECEDIARELIELDAQAPSEEPHK